MNFTYKIELHNFFFLTFGALEWEHLRKIVYVGNGKKFVCKQKKKYVLILHTNL